MNALTPILHTLQPDASCISKGDSYLLLACRCYAAAGLSNPDIASRLLCLVDLPDLQPDTAAAVFAQHCARVCVPKPQIIAWLARLAAEVPAWLPSDPDEIAGMARAVLRAEDSP
jgi:hypothetical protein